MRAEPHGRRVEQGAYPDAARESARDRRRVCPAVLGVILHRRDSCGALFTTRATERSDDDASSDLRKSGR